MNILRTPPAKGTDKSIDKDGESIKPGSKLQDSLSKGVGSLTISQNQVNPVEVCTPTHRFFVAHDLMYR